MGHTPSELIPLRYLEHGVVGDWNQYRSDFPDWEVPVDTHVVVDGLDLAGIDLSGLIFPDLSCVGTSFTESNLCNATMGSPEKPAALARADFREAWLIGTDLQHTKGLEETALAGSMMLGASLPIGFVFTGLRKVEEIAKNSRTNFFLLIIASVLSFLGWMDINDFQATTNQGLPILPFLNKPINVNGFFGITPLLLLFFFGYFQLYLQSLWQALAMLPAFFPDGRSLLRKAYPWVLNTMVSYHVHYLLLRIDEIPHRDSLVRQEVTRKQLEESQTKYIKFSKFVILILCYFLIPLVIFMLWIGSLVLRDWLITASNTVVLAIAVFACLTFYRDIRIRFGRNDQPRSWKWDSPSSYHPKFWSISLLIMLSGVSLFVLTKNPFLESHYRTNYEKAFASGTTCDVHNNRTWWCRTISAEVSDRHFATKPKAPSYDRVVLEGKTRSDVKDTDEKEDLSSYYDQIRTNAKAMVNRFDLSGQSLDYANIENGFMVNMNLEGATMRAASLINVDLTGADLTSVDLRSAVLHKASLVATDLGCADLRDSYLVGVDLSRAVIRSTVFSGANMRKIKIFATEHRDVFDVRGNDLHNAVFVDFKTQILLDRGNWTNGRAKRIQMASSHFSGADLRGTVVEVGDFNGSFFQRADLRETQLLDVVLTNARFDGANLERAAVIGDMTAAIFNRADLSSATIKGTLNDALLFETILYATDLRQAQGLTFEQLKDACLNQLTKLPDYLLDRKQELLDLPCSTDPK